MVFNFESDDELNKWNIYEGGIASIDETNKYEGNSSLSVKANNDCFHLEIKSALSVKSNKTYIVRYQYQLPEGPDGEFIHCAARFLNWFKQQDKTVITESCLVNNNWVEKQIFFQVDNDTPVKLEFLVGTESGIWIDNMIVFEEK